MKSNKELLDELEKLADLDIDLAAQKVGMAGLPCPSFDVPQESTPEPEAPHNVPKLNRKQRRAAAKKAMRQAKEPAPTVHYICDPSKNIQCKKTSCYLYGGPCKCTKNIAYAKQPVETAQMIIPVSGEERRDLMKQYAKELKDK